MTPHNPQVVAVDIGNGWTKAVGGLTTAIIRSLIAPAQTISYHSALSHNGHGLTLDYSGEQYFVGDRALLQSRRATPDRERHRDPLFNRLMLLGALTELDVQGEVLLVTGLPVDWMGDAEALKTVLRGAYTYTVNGQARAVNITRVAVQPQTFGPLFREVFDETGRPTDPRRLGRKRAFSINVGMLTTDMAYSDKLEYREPYSHTLATGAQDVYTNLKDRVDSRYHVDSPEAMLEDAVLHDGHITIAGNRVNITPQIDAACRNLAGDITRVAGQLLREQADFLDEVPVSGGLAARLLPYLREKFSTAWVVDSPQTATAEGFYRYGLYAANAA